MFGELCFKILEKEGGKFWNLCAAKLSERNQWVCAIKKDIGQDCNVAELQNQQVQKVTVEQPLIVIPIPSPMCNEKWEYSSHGDDWQCKCVEGHSQSPINLPNKKEAIKTKNDALFSFRTVQPLDGGNALRMVLEDHKLIIYVKSSCLIFHLGKFWKVGRFEFSNLPSTKA